MINLDSTPPNLTLSRIPLLGPDPAPRLLVLIPTDTDCATATRRVWELANALGASIQFLGLCKDAAEESGLRRALVTMSALVQDGRIVSQAKVEIGTNWVSVVKNNYQSGDVIVCFAEQRAGLLHKPLSQILESNLKAPIYVLSGLYLGQSRSNWRSQVMVWTGSIGIILGFAILQVRIVQLPKDWFQNVLLILSLIPEYWLIWVWNSLFS